MSKAPTSKAPLKPLLSDIKSDSDERVLQVSGLKSIVMHNHSFENFLRDAVDEVFSTLGDSAKQATYFCLGKSFNISRLDIPYKIEEFRDALEEIYGLGGKLLEIQIMKCLYQKVGPSFEYSPKQDELIFTEYVEAVKSSVL